MINPATGKQRRSPEEMAAITEATTYRTDSLCWECARACGGGGCPWADSLKPVQGWKILGKKSLSRTSGVTVVYCPMFIKGRNLDYATDEQLASTSTNCTDSICRLIVKHDKECDTKLYECPKCEKVYESRVSTCKKCRSKFLSDKSTDYITSYAKILTRKQFFKDYQEDFPNAKFTYKQGE